jgi:hypothetical protein
VVLERHSSHAIALFNLIKSPIISFILATCFLSLLIFAQTKRWIKNLNLLIIAAVGFGIVLFIPDLVVPQVIFVSVVAGLMAIAATAPNPKARLRNWYSKVNY